jgi:hypothetical protein
MMATLGDLAKLVRSKNAGPFWLTIDIMFDDAAAYRRARDAEIVNRAIMTSWADLQSAHHREALRCRVWICELIRAGLVAKGIDRALAVALRIGDDAVAELDAIPDTPELQASDEITLRLG